MNQGPGSEPRDAVIGALVAGRGRFLAFLARRVGDQDLAEDLLQTAVLQAVRRSHKLREEDRVVAWIYRILRNVLADHGRKATAAARAATQAVALELPEVPAPEVEAEVCACVGGVLELLPGQYRDLLRLVELEGLSPNEAAARLGVTNTNARVRLHRARVALRKRVEEVCRTCATHQCIDCTCRSDRRPVGV